MKGKTARRLFHAVGGSVLPLLALVLTRDALLWFVGSVAALFVTGEALRLLIPSLNRWLMSVFSGMSSSFKETEAARPIGTTYLLVGSFFTFLFFPRELAVAGLFFAAIGDPVAAECGEHFGRLRIGRKSFEGTMAFFVSSLVVGFVLIWSGLQLSWLAMGVGALVASLVELAPIPVNDNTTIPVVSAAAMTLAL